MSSSSSLTTTRNGRVFFFSFVYFVQGCILAFVYVYNNLYVRSAGGSAEQLALLNGLLAIPFIAKVGIGILSDRVSLFDRGYRRPYMTLGAIMMSGGSLLISGVEPVEQYPLYVICALFIATGLAFFDTTADGFAIDVTPKEEMGLIQATMVIGRGIGFVMMASIYGRVITNYGWSVAFWIIAVFALLPFATMWRAPEAAQRTEQQRFSWAAFRSMLHPSRLNLMLYSVIASFVVYGTNTLVPLYINEALGQSITAVGDTAALGSVGMLVGGLIITSMIARTTIWRLGRVIIGLIFIALVLLSQPSIQQYTTLILIVWGGCLAASDFIFVTLAMQRSDTRLGASSFAIFMAISNVAIGIAQATTTGLIDTVDYRWQFLGLGALSLLLFPMLERLRRITPPLVEAEPTLEVAAGD